MKRARTVKEGEGEEEEEEPGFVHPLKAWDLTFGACDPLQALKEDVRLIRYDGN